MKKQTKEQCVYCDELETKDNPVKEWKETYEMVCYDCRLSLLNQEFEEEKGNGGENTLAL